MIVMAQYVPAQGAYEEGMQLSTAYTFVCMDFCSRVDVSHHARNQLGPPAPPHHTPHDQSNAVTHFYIPCFLTMIQMGPNRWIEI